MAVLQMTWQPSSLSQKHKRGPPLGLENLGNTCYLNSVLQCLTYTPALANFCLKAQHSSSCDLEGVTASCEKKRECPFCILERRIERSLSSEFGTDSPGKINSCMKIFAEHFRHGRQEDAHEFLRYVIDACHNTCLRLKKLQLQRQKGGECGNEGTIVKEIFGGALQSQVKCLSCGAESNKEDEIMDISLDVLHSGSLKDALQRFFQHEILDGNNKYKCESCKKLVAAKKQMSILQAPNVVVIHLKRFEGILGGKINKTIAFEEILVLSSYMCKGSQDLHPEYRLFGTIVHSGFSHDSGHYFAYIKDAKGHWYCCNDSSVSLSNLEEVLSEKAYILFFTRSKQRQPFIKPGSLANGSKYPQSNVSDASKILKSKEPEKVANSTKPLPDLHSESDNSIELKVDKVSSNHQRKLTVYESSSARTFRANGGMKIIVHRTEPIQKIRSRTDTADTDKENNVPKFGNANGVSNVMPDGTEKTKLHSITVNGNSKIQNANGHSAEGGHNRDVHSPEQGNCRDSHSTEGGQYGDNHSTVAGHSRGCVSENNVASNPSVSIDAANEQNNLRRLSSGNGITDAEPDDAFDALKRKLPSLVANGNCKIQNFSGHSLDRDHHGENVDKDNMSMGKPPNHMEFSNGNVKSHPDSFGVKRKLQDENSCVLLAKDAQSCAEVEELKKVMKKKAALDLVSCGWSDEVYDFMHSRKKMCLGGTGFDASNLNEVKRSLIKDAQRTCISKIPESLKRELIEQLTLFSKEK